MMKRVDKMNEITPRSKKGCASMDEGSHSCTVIFELRVDPVVSKLPAELFFLVCTIRISHDIEHIFFSFCHYVWLFVFVAQTVAQIHAVVDS